MLDLEKFKNSLKFITVGCKVEASDEQISVIYELLRDEKINDDEYCSACRLIALREKLYGKLPEPVVFCDYVLKVRKEKFRQSRIIGAQKPPSECIPMFPATQATDDEKTRELLKRAKEMFNAYLTPAYRKIYEITSPTQTKDRVVQTFKGKLTEEQILSVL